MDAMTNLLNQEHVEKFAVLMEMQCKKQGHLNVKQTAILLKWCGLPLLPNHDANHVVKLMNQIAEQLPRWFMLEIKKIGGRSTKKKTGGYTFYMQRISLR